MKRVLLYGVCIFFGVSEIFASQKVDGFNIGVGVNIGRHNTSRNDNDLFDGDKKSIKSVVWGGSISIGYIKKINQFGIGLDLGCDADKSSKQLKISGYANNRNSVIYQSTINKIDRLTFNILRSMTDYIVAECLFDGNNVAGDPIPQDIARCLNNCQYFFRGSNQQYDLMNVIEDFFGEENCQQLNYIGNNNFSYGMQMVGKFLSKYCPDAEYILSNIAKNQSNTIVGNVIMTLSMGRVPTLHAVGIDDQHDTKYATYNVFKHLLEPDFSDNVTQNIKFKTKSRFELSPHIGLKFGFYLDDNKSFIYSKIGVIQLNGRVVAGEKDDNLGAYFDVKSKNFHKITPMLTFGFNRQIGCSGWGVGFEISHAFKTSKKLDPVDVIGFKIYPKAKISRTSVRFLVTKTF